MISVVINLDTRKGLYADCSTTGDFGGGSLQGVRSIDFLTDGVLQKARYFRGHEIEVIAYIDEVNPLDPKVVSWLKEHVAGVTVVHQFHDHDAYRWNDEIYLNALQLAQGDYVAHFDGDANAFREDDSTIVERYFDALDGDFRYVCQPIQPIEGVDPWPCASTRFFICKRETLDYPAIRKVLHEYPCLEHALGALAGAERILYPDPGNRDHMVFSWARYYRGVLKQLNEMDYADAFDYVNSLGGLYSPTGDVIARKIS